MKATTGVVGVIFDAAARRYEGQVHLPQDGKPSILRVSAPGHPAWGYRRISSALIASARNQTAGGHDARA